ncbi:hypothetical protein EON65_54210 [archaeon]|nr:MAG: hypothetical protein EON65_54210 [archaeon]
MFETRRPYEATIGWSYRNVETTTDLAETAAAQDIAHICQKTARRVLHDKGLKAMHTIKKPFLTRENGRTLLWHIVIGQCRNGSKSSSLTRHLS